MTLNLDLAPEIESRLQEKAAREGLDIATYLSRLITQLAELDSKIGHPGNVRTKLQKTAAISAEAPALPEAAHERARFDEG